MGSAYSDALYCHRPSHGPFLLKELLLLPEENVNSSYPIPSTFAFISTLYNSSYLVYTSFASPEIKFSNGNVIAIELFAVYITLSMDFHSNLVNLYTCKKIR